MKSTARVMIMLEDGIIQQQFGVMTFLLSVMEKTLILRSLKMALGKEFSYEIDVKDGMINLTFTSEGQPIGQDDVEHENAYMDEGHFFRLGCYIQTNAKSPEVNRNWYSCAETHGGDIQKKYEDANYAEVWFKTASIFVSDAAISNEGYFMKND